MKKTYSSVILFVLIGITYIPSIAQPGDIEMINLKDKSHEEIREIISSDLRNRTIISDGAAILVISPTKELVNKITTDDLTSEVKIEKMLFKEANTVLFFSQNNKLYFVEIDPVGKSVSDVILACPIENFSSVSAHGGICFSPDNELMAFAIQDAPKEEKFRAASVFVQNLPVAIPAPGPLIIYDKSYKIISEIPLNKIDESFNYDFGAISNTGKAIVYGEVGPSNRAEGGYWIWDGVFWSRLDFDDFGKDNPLFLDRLIDMGFSSDDKAYLICLAKLKGDDDKQVYRYTYDLKDQKKMVDRETLGLDSVIQDQDLDDMFVSEHVGGRVFFGVKSDTELIIGTYKNGFLEWAERGIPEGIDPKPSWNFIPFMVHDRFLVIYAEMNKLGLDISEDKSVFFLFNNHDDGRGKRVIVEHHQRWFRMEGEYNIKYTVINPSLVEISEKEKGSHILLKLD